MGIKFKVSIRIKWYQCSKHPNLCLCPSVFYSSTVRIEHNILRIEGLEQYSEPNSWKIELVHDSFGFSMIETDGPSGNIRKTILLDNWIHFILCCWSRSLPTHFLERFLLRDIWKMGGNPLLLIPALEKWDGIKHNFYIFQRKAHWNTILNIMPSMCTPISYFFHLFYMLQKFVPILSENSWKVIVSSSPILPFSLFPAQGK